MRIECDEMTNTSVAIGIIGAGIMGERLLNAILQQDPDMLHVCGIWDPSPEAMRRMEQNFPEVPRMSDASAIIAASDCVYIASPPASHLGHARAALAAGKRSSARNRSPSMSAMHAPSWPRPATVAP
jgi:Predicted dehydrogenases and related proteins